MRVPYPPAGSTHTYQFYTIRVYEGRDQLREHLERKGITTKIYFPVLWRLPVAEEVASQVLTLPMYPSLLEEEMDYIAESVREFDKV